MIDASKALASSGRLNSKARPRASLRTALASRCPSTTSWPICTSGNSVSMATPDREISTIPRSSHPDDGNGNSKGPANQEQETGADAKSGNWIYPSERMFFEAMKRKGHDPEATDMRTVVPIHNAVNERAWAEIKKWEAPWLEGSK